MADWSELPDDILKLIARRLHSIEDYVKFGGVCRSWHQVFLRKDCSSSSMIPWLMFKREENSDICCFYSPFCDKFYEVHLPMISGKESKDCWGSGHGWLVSIGTGMDMHILNPLSKVQIPLPPLHNCPNLKLECTAKEFVDKVILSSNPSSSDCVVMVIHSFYKKLAFARPGNEAWTPLECSPGPFDDIIYFNGNFFIVNSSQVVFVCNSIGSHIKTIATVPVFHVDSQVCVDNYLVEYRTEIYMVMQCLCDIGLPNLKTLGFIVFKLDMYTEKWEVVKTLDDWSIFLGNNHLFAICGSDYLEWRKNCIYFMDNYLGNNRSSSFDLKIYNFEDDKVESYAREHGSQFVFYETLWIRPSLW